MKPRKSAMRQLSTNSRRNACPKTDSQHNKELFTLKCNFLILKRKNKKRKGKELEVNPQQLPFRPSYSSSNELMLLLIVAFGSSCLLSRHRAWPSPLTSITVAGSDRNY